MANTIVSFNPPDESLRLRNNAELIAAKYRKIEFQYSEFREYMKNTINNLQGTLNTLKTTQEYFENRYRTEMKELEQMFAEEEHAVEVSNATFNVSPSQNCTFSWGRSFRTGDED